MDVDCEKVHEHYIMVDLVSTLVPRFKLMIVSSYIMKINIS